MAGNEKLKLFPALQDYIESLFDETKLIPENRRTLLTRMARYITRKLEAGQPAALNFICTHNSRRSHISQIWAATAAAYFELEGVQTYSGGTEATGFNPRAVAAIRRAGFQINVHDAHGENPHYFVSFAKNRPPLVCFSKTYDHPINPGPASQITDHAKDTGHPGQAFAAVMTCAEADENCPFIPGAEFRLALTYEDPKEADDTPQERQRYDERVRQIGREIFYAMQLTKKGLNRP